jgi:hypothetical protein
MEFFMFVKSLSSPFIIWISILVGLVTSLNIHTSGWLNFVSFTVFFTGVCLVSVALFVSLVGLIYKVLAFVLGGLVALLFGSVSSANDTVNGASHSALQDAPVLNDRVEKDDVMASTSLGIGMFSHSLTNDPELFMDNDLGMDNAGFSNDVLGSDTMSINPATGLPMVDGMGSVDVAGNPFGTDLNSLDELHSTDDLHGGLDDTFHSGVDDFNHGMDDFGTGIDDFSSGFDDFSSGFDDSFS